MVLRSDTVHVFLGSLNRYLPMMHLTKLIVVCVAIGSLVYVNGIDLYVFSEILWGSYVELSVSLIIFLFVTCLGGFRWFLLMQAVDVPISLRQCFRIHMIGMFFVFYVPGGGAGSDLIKAYYVHKESGKASSLALTSIFIDRVIGVYSLLLIGVVAIFVNQKIPIEGAISSWNAWFYIIVFAFSSAIIGFFLTRSASRLFNTVWLKKLPFSSVLFGFISSIERYRGKISVLFLSLVLSLFLHLMMILVFHFSAIALSLGIPFLVHAYLVPLLLLINLIPITPGGLGVGEVASFGLYSGVGFEGGGELFLLFHAYLFINSALGAPFYFIHKNQDSMN